MIEPVDFLNLAKELNEDDSGQEAKHRTSISRAYYAAYHEAAQCYASHENLELTDSLFGNHQAFIRKLQENRSEKLIRTIGNQLYDLKKDRIKADYKLNQEVTSSAAKKSFFASTKIITNSDKLLRT